MSNRETKGRIAFCALGSLIGAILCLGMLGMFSPPSATAKSPITEFITEPSSTQAGGHPDMLFRFSAGNRFTQGFPSDCYCENPKDLKVSAPTGVIGAPHALPQCSAALFLQARCSPDSQIGLQVYAIAGLSGFSLWTVTPLFNLEPRPDQPGLAGFLDPIAGTPTFEEVSSRTESDYGVDVTVISITGVFTPKSFRTVLWGVPSDPVHTPLRYPRGSRGGYCVDLNTFESIDPTPFVFGEGAALPSSCLSFSGPAFAPTPSNAPLKPFTANPTTCGVPLTATLETLAYDHGRDFATTSWPATTGCDQLAFNPSLSAVPTTDQTDTASGLDVKLSVPQGDSPLVPSASQIRGTTVTMPEGFSINPNAADGKTSCSDAQGAFGTRDAAQCPEHAKVGTVKLLSSALPDVVEGGIYLGEPLPGNRYRLFLTADGFGTHIKLAGSVHPDPETGQIVVSFKDLPQSPLTEFNMHFFGSERGLLATPAKCGTYAVNTTFEPWNSALADQVSTQFFKLNSGPNGAPCPGSTRPFSPSLRAGMADNTAAKHTPFHLNLTRPDGDQILTALNVKTPPGFSATLKGIPYCSEAALSQLTSSTYGGRSEQASPACSSASQIGTALVGTGAGSHPLYTPGKVYLAGPYKGAPLSLVVVVPAVSGPYDLGNVAVRTALSVDPTSAQVTAISDPLPQILEGIPLRIRSIAVSLDRESFTLNPTNCDPLSLGTEVFGDQGGLAKPSFHFQVANCAGLDFAPKLALRLSGSTKRTGNPALRATLNANPGDANIAATQVTLPLGQLIDNAHIQNPCTRVQFAADACPEGSIIGSAKAESPLLDKPLQGAVYLRSSSNKLPDMVVDLKGQIDVELAARIDTVKARKELSRLRTTFTSLPDVPVSSFILNLLGGKRGLLENTGNLCKSARFANVAMDGQNGASVDSKVEVKSPCGSDARKKKRAKRAKKAGAR